jgi:hypothetical protein
MSVPMTPSSRAREAAIVLAGGIAAGTFDIVYAWLFWFLKAGVPMQRILQSVAKGLLGSASYEGGASTALLGLVLHYFIATSMAFTYYLVARRWPALARRPWAFGPAYGLLLYGIMNYVVLPLSAAGPPAADRLWTALSIVVHMALIGLPIALAAGQALRDGSGGPLRPEMS